MTAIKRALLIASPFEGLRGPLNDVKTMERLLSLQGFEILTCRGTEATRQSIMDAWENIIRLSNPNDIVVIYYSGHGGTVEDVANKPGVGKETATTCNNHHVTSSSYPWISHFQVLPRTLKPLLLVAFWMWSWKTYCTSRPPALKTSPPSLIVVTLAAWIATLPMPMPCPATFPKFEHAAVSEKFNLLRRMDGNLGQASLHDEGNPYAVRIAAAGALETAWEDGDGDERAGVMTRELAIALHEAWKAIDGGNQISWQKILLRVRELVNINFPRQNPHVEGPHTRMLFSLDVSETNAIVLRPDGQNGILKAGRISGVRVGNVYALIALGSARVRNEAKSGEATVTEVDALEATAELSLLPGKNQVPAHDAMAFLVK